MASGQIYIISCREHHENAKQLLRFLDQEKVYDFAINSGDVNSSLTCHKRRAVS